MNELLRDRIMRKLEGLPDERLYQVLDYVEFLDSKYAARQNPPTNVFQRFAEGVEDKLRAGRVSASTITETMNLMNRAMNVLSGVAAAGKSVANEIVGAAATTTSRPPAAGGGGSAGGTPPASGPSAGSSAKPPEGASGPQPPPSPPAASSPPPPPAAQTQPPGGQTT